MDFNRVKYSVVVLVVKPQRKFLLYRNMWTKKDLRKLKKWLIDNGYKPVYFSLTFAKSGKKYTYNSDDI